MCVQQSKRSRHRKNNEQRTTKQQNNNEKTHSTTTYDVFFYIRKMIFPAIQLFLLLSFYFTLSTSFTSSPSISQSFSLHHFQHHPLYSNSNNNDKEDEALLNSRLQKLRTEILEKEVQDPPNADLSPKELIIQILNILKDYDNPTPEHGFRVFLRTCSPRFQDMIRKSIGADVRRRNNHKKSKQSNNNNEDIIASALGSALTRPNNQFGLLFEEDYELLFPSDIVDYYDGTCWVESRLVSSTNGSLLAVIGWELERVSSSKDKNNNYEDDENAFWLISNLDWQDFRDNYRPGIGREEWSRICG